MCEATADSSDLKVPFGRRGDELVGPGDVSEAGLACGCVCPDAGQDCYRAKVASNVTLLTTMHRAQCFVQGDSRSCYQVLLKAKRLVVPSTVIHIKITPTLVGQ
jgi:hypothetical protein